MEQSVETRNGIIFVSVISIAFLLMCAINVYDRNAPVGNDPGLIVGTWAWDSDHTVSYVFNADHTYDIFLNGALDASGKWSYMGDNSYSFIYHGNSFLMGVKGNTMTSLNAGTTFHHPV